MLVVHKGGFTGRPKKVVLFAIQGCLRLDRVPKDDIQALQTEESSAICGSRVFKTKQSA